MNNLYFPQYFITQNLLRYWEYPQYFFLTVLKLVPFLPELNNCCCCEINIIYISYFSQFYSMKTNLNLLPIMHQNERYCRMPTTQIAGLRMKLTKLKVGNYMCVCLYDWICFPHVKIKLLNVTHAAQNGKVEVLF